MILTGGEPDGGLESAVSDGPIGAEVDQNPWRARFDTGKLVVEGTANATQQLRRVDGRPFIDGDKVGSASVVFFQRQVLEPMTNSLVNYLLPNYML